MDNFCLHSIMKSHLECVWSRHKHLIYKIQQKGQHIICKIRLQNTVASISPSFQSSRCKVPLLSAPVIIHKDTNGKGLVYLSIKEPTKTCGLPPTMCVILEAEPTPVKPELTAASIHTSIASLLTLNQRHQTQPDFWSRNYQRRNASYFKSGGYFIM